MYEVFVKNVGKVHDGHTEQGARETYDLYVRRSILGLGRAAQEAATLMHDGRVVLEHDPEAPKAQDIASALAHAGKGEWSHVGSRALKGRVTIRYAGRYCAEYRGQEDLLGQGSTPVEALEHLQGQIKELIEALKEAL